MYHIVPSIGLEVSLWLSGLSHLHSVLVIVSIALHVHPVGPKESIEIPKDLIPVAISEGVVISFHGISVSVVDAVTIPVDSVSIADDYVSAIGENPK